MFIHSILFCTVGASMKNVLHGNTILNVKTTNIVIIINTQKGHLKFFVASSPKTLIILSIANTLMGFLLYHLINTCTLYSALNKVLPCGWSNMSTCYLSVQTILFSKTTSKYQTNTTLLPCQFGQQYLNNATLFFNVTFFRCCLKTTSSYHTSLCKSQYGTIITSLGVLILEVIILCATIGTCKCVLI